MKKTTSLLAALALAFCLLAGCAGSPPEQPAASPSPAQSQEAEKPSPSPETTPVTSPEKAEARVLHDSYGDVTVEGDVERVISTAPAYTVSVLLMGGADKLVGIDSNTGGNAWLLKMFPQLQDVPVVTVNGELNLETVMDLTPDLVILTPAMQGQLERVQELGLPVINEPVYGDDDTLLERNRDRQMYYGVAMGGESLEIADTYEQYFNDMVDNVKSRTAALADSERPVVLEIRSLDPLTVCNGNDRSVAQEWITAAGGVNAAGENTQDGKSGSWEVSVEQVLSWDPEYVVCSNTATKAALLADAQYSGLRAVQEGKVVDMPKGLMVWGYNGPELPLFVEFAGKFIHPELFADVDVVADARAFYADFFGMDVSDEELQSIFFTDLPLAEYAAQTFAAE